MLGISEAFEESASLVVPPVILETALLLEFTVLLAIDARLPWFNE